MLLIGQMVVPDGSVFVYGRADKTFLLYPVELVITRIAIGSKQLIKFLADIRVFRCNLWVLSKKAGIYPVFNGKHLWFFRPGSGCKIPWHTVTTGSSTDCSPTYSYDSGTCDSGGDGGGGD